MVTVTAGVASASALTGTARPPLATSMSVCQGASAAASGPRLGLAGGRRAPGRGGGSAAPARGTGPGRLRLPGLCHACSEAPVTVTAHPSHGPGDSDLPPQALFNGLARRGFHQQTSDHIIGYYWLLFRPNDSKN